MRLGGSVKVSRGNPLWLPLRQAQGKLWAGTGACPYGMGSMRGETVQIEREEKEC
jgi:hypothetical protein